jgi:hypothetical protein
MTKDKIDAKALGGDWFEQASTMLLLFIKTHQGRFKAEHVRVWAEGCGMSAPHDRRAWGNVFKSAEKAKIIFSSGYEKQDSPSCHGSPKNVWKKA